MAEIESNGDVPSFYGLNCAFDPGDSAKRKRADSGGLLGHFQPVPREVIDVEDETKRKSKKAKTDNAGESKMDTQPDGAKDKDKPKKKSKSNASTDDKKRKFQPKWLKGREDWLEPTPAGMLCKLCKKAGVIGVWSTLPCTTIRERSVEKHETSAEHLKSLNELVNRGTLDFSKVALKSDLDLLSGWADAFVDIYWLATEEV